MECYEKYDTKVCVTDLVSVNIRDFEGHVGIVIGIRLMEPCIHVAIKGSDYFFYAYDLQVVSRDEKSLDGTPKGD